MGFPVHASYAPDPFFLAQYLLAQHVPVWFADAAGRRAHSCDSILSDMHSFRKRVQSLGQSVAAHDDPSAEPLLLQELGYALLDMAKSACRLMKLLLENNVPTAPADGTVADDADVRKSRPPPMTDEQSKSERTARSSKGSGEETMARSSMVSVEEPNQDDGQRDTEEEAPHTTIRDQWDVDEADVLLEHYINHVGGELKKRGAPFVMLKGLCWYFVQSADDDVWSSSRIVNPGPHAWLPGDMGVAMPSRTCMTMHHVHVGDTEAVRCRLSSTCLWESHGTLLIHARAPSC